MLGPDYKECFSPVWDFSPFRRAETPVHSLWQMVIKNELLITWNLSRWNFAAWAETVALLYLFCNLNSGNYKMLWFREIHAKSLNLGQGWVSSYYNWKKNSAQIETSPCNRVLSLTSLICCLLCFALISCLKVFLHLLQMSRNCFCSFLYFLHYMSVIIKFAKRPWAIISSYNMQPSFTV